MPNPPVTGHCVLIDELSFINNRHEDDIQPGGSLKIYGEVNKITTKLIWPYLGTTSYNITLLRCRFTGTCGRLCGLWRSMGLRPSSWLFLVLSPLVL